MLLITIQARWMVFSLLCTFPAFRFLSTTKRAQSYLERRPQEASVTRQKIIHTYPITERSRSNTSCQSAMFFFFLQDWASPRHTYAEQCEERSVHEVEVRRLGKSS